ncbi:unnamed protein product, partial [Timema podura]|nr:unnamed protein product [Timema podura]
MVFKIVSKIIGRKKHCGLKGVKITTICYGVYTTAFTELEHYDKKVSSTSTALEILHYGLIVKLPPAPSTLLEKILPAPLDASNRFQSRCQDGVIGFRTGCDGKWCV